VYTKNLEHLLRLLQVSRQSGLLIVEPPEQERALWQGQFWLVEGTIRTCQIYQMSDMRVVLRNDDAIRWLIAQGRLSWRMEEGEQGPSTILPALPQPGGNTKHESEIDLVSRETISSGPRETISSGPRETISSGPQERVVWVPQRTARGAQIVAQSLGSFEHIQVFTLVNGQNTVEGIARLVRKPPGNILRILYDLRSAGLIK
jgi:hypothetical protein